MLADKSKVRQVIALSKSSDLLPIGGVADQDSQETSSIAEMDQPEMTLASHLAGKGVIVLTTQENCSG